MYNRLISQKIAKSTKSILLLGPRQVGKSTLIKSLNPDLEIDLSDEQELFLFQSDKGELKKRLAARKIRTVFIDEIQRLPSLTNSIQSIVDHDSRIKFYLTGSSARKLRRGQANLLPGRILSYTLGPLSCREVGSDWDEVQALAFGSLPGIYSNSNKNERLDVLRSYAATYVKEEVQSEAMVRNIEGFVRFLQVAGSFAGNFLDFSKMAKRAGIPRQSVTRHFEILEDTLIARRCGVDPDLNPEELDLVRHPKFFFFDNGVLNALRGSFDLSSERVGYLFEHLVFNQLCISANASSRDFDIFNFRTRGGYEVDFIVNIDGSKFALECKANTRVHDDEVRKMLRIENYYPKIKKLIVYRGHRELKSDGVWILPLPKAIDVLGIG